MIVKVIYWLVFHGLLLRTLIASRMAEYGRSFSFLHLSVQLASRFILIWDSLFTLDRQATRDTPLPFPGLALPSGNRVSLVTCTGHTDVPAPSPALARWALVGSLGRTCTVFPLTDSDGRTEPLGGEELHTGTRRREMGKHGGQVHLGQMPATIAQILKGSVPQGVRNLRFS